MKRVALLFVLAVFVPSLVLAWLSVRSLRDQQFVLERQQSLLLQGLADRLARDAETYLDERQREFVAQVEALMAESTPADLSRRFDDALRQSWPLADVGFVVTLSGNLLSPSPFGRPDARTFCIANSAFLGNREAVEVYWNTPKGSVSLKDRASEVDKARKDMLADLQKAGDEYKALIESASDRAVSVEERDKRKQAAESKLRELQDGEAKIKQFDSNARVQLGEQQRNLRDKIVAEIQQSGQQQSGQADNQLKNEYSIKNSKRTVTPQQALLLPGGQGGQGFQAKDNNEFENTSKVAVAEAEFRQLIGDSTEGTLARFLDNKLKLMFWYRPPRDPSLVFGAQLQLPALIADLRPVVKVEAPLHEEVCVALLDDAARPLAVSHAGFQPASWKRPFVATEIGEALPHWEMAVYLLDPKKLGQSAQTLTLTISLLVAMLVLAIGAGGWLIVADLRRQLTLARQKTDFVSNVSHELKTPLTSIRMFSELLAEGRVTDAAKQRNYLQVITAEAARLTRLINNVLDFSRLERGEKKYAFTRCDLGAVVTETVETYRPHLEQAGFKLELDTPPAPVFVNGDRDALAQVLVNLLSNAEKYSNGQKEIRVELRQCAQPLPFLEVRVLDRGLGVPPGTEERIFEQFYRAHDSLSSGIQGSGLGLTLARQIARAHGGEVSHEAREGGGSCFMLRLPVAKEGSG
jgi:signal transduction histidine kinase